MAVKDPLNRRERRHIRDNDPVLSNRPWGVDLPLVFQQFAEDIQAEIDSLLPVAAFEVSYDNATSGLTATNVQDAIDEIAAGGGGFSKRDVSTHIKVPATTALYLEHEGINLCEIPLLPGECTQITSMTVVANTGDLGTFDLVIAQNGSDVFTGVLAASTLKAQITVTGVSGLSPTDEITVRVKRRTGSGKSAFKRLRITLHMEP